MKQFFSVFLFIISLLIFGSCEKKQEGIIFDKSYISEIKQIRRDFAGFLTRNYIPGGTVAISKNNAIIYSEGMGIASKDLDVPMTRENITRIGDVSQIFTGIIYLKLVKEGILIPDSSIQYYLNEYPETEYRIKLRHLPYHTSGIRRQEKNEAEMKGLNPSIQQGIECFMHDEITSPPGWFEEFSIFNTNLLGAVMENATHIKFPELLKKYITDTLNLTNTLVDNPTIPISGRSEYYDVNMLGQIVNAPFQDIRYMAPSKGILSNAEDLVKLGMALLESDYFDDEFKQQLFKPCDLYGNKKSTTAYGWLLTTDETGRDVNLCIGSVTGGGAAMLLFPEERLVVACTMNSTLGNESIPIFDIAKHFLVNSK